MTAIEKEIINFFKKLPHVAAVILFGSFARKTANERSDVDVAILFEKQHLESPEKILSLREDLSALLNRDVDLICLNTVSPILGMQVYKNGKILEMRNEREFADYQMRLFSEYAELKELRAPMEKDILKRKLYD